MAKARKKKETLAQKVIRFIESYCIVPEGKLVGKLFSLEPFQKRFLFAVYDNKHITNKAILSIGRKNGKTGLIACLVLAYLIGPVAVRNAQIVGGAMSRDQAAIVFNYCAKMIKLSPVLSRLIAVAESRKELKSLTNGSVYSALSSDAKTKLGLSARVVIIDEGGQIKGERSKFVETLETSQGATQDPIIFYISTQAEEDGDYLSIIIDDAETFKDPKTVCHVYTSDKDCDLLDEEQWKKSNPALGVFRTIEDMRRLAEDAKRMPSKEAAFRNLNLNQRVVMHDPFVTREAWESCKVNELRPLNEAKYVYAGLDLSARCDLTSFVLLGVFDDGVVEINPYFWLPDDGLLDRAKNDRVPYEKWKKEGLLFTTTGGAIEYDEVISKIVDLLDGISLQSLSYDRWNINQFKQSASRLGVGDLPLEPFGQGFKDMSPAIGEFEALILNKKIKHAGHPVLNWCISNVKVEKDPADNRKFNKRRSSGRIDGAVATVMAIGAKLNDKDALDDGDENFGFMIL